MRRSGVPEHLAILLVCVVLLQRMARVGARARGEVAATVAMPQISRAQTATLRLQTSWPATDIFTEMCQQYITRVNEMAGGRLKIDLLHGGAVFAVEPAEVPDATLLAAVMRY